MFRGCEITPPFFEVGPKAYAYGDEVVALARLADALSLQYGVQIVLTPQYTDIPLVAAAVDRVLVFAQHMDPILPGRGVGAVLPDALKAAGARGVLLNHAERRLSRPDLARAMERADEVGLATMVCADDLQEALGIARLGPNAIIVEAPGQIGVGGARIAADGQIGEVNRAIWEIDPDIRVLHAAGIGSPRDVYDVIAAGAQGTGSSSAIFTAADPAAMLAAMVAAVCEAWDRRQ